MTIIVRKLIPATAPAIDLSTARDAVTTAAAIIERMDGRRMTEADRQTVLADALDLAFYIAGEPGHLDAAAVEARARVIAGGAS
jgi:hypothetical protein